LSYSTIRAEVPEDNHAINALTLKAFAPMPFSNGSEAPILRALRRAGELTLSLVALAEEGKTSGTWPSLLLQSTTCTMDGLGLGLLPSIQQFNVQASDEHWFSRAWMF
jgi:predicted N-acetyltransferase YhbS